MPENPSKKQWINEAHSESSPPPLYSASERSEEVVKGYKNAFSSVSDEEVAILDGVILE